MCVPSPPVYAVLGKRTPGFVHNKASTPSTELYPSPLIILGENGGRGFSCVVQAGLELVAIFLPQVCAIKPGYMHISWVALGEGTYFPIYSWSLPMYIL